MYIQPNTNIKILKNAPLDADYINTLWFDSLDSQRNYFTSLTKYNLSEHSYQRVNKDTMRVQIKVENLYDCNYLMFQNASFGDKWFYAFITKVDYINDITAEITYNIDVMQTWLFEVELNKSFVIREHTETDEIGDNLVPETLELGDYISDDMLVPSNSEGVPIISRHSIVVAAPFDKEYNNIDGSMYGGIYSGLCYNAFPLTNDGAVECTEFISGASTRFLEDQIVGVFILPTAFLTGRLEPIRTYNVSFDKLNSNMFGATGHHIRNNKLYTYPYNFLYCSNLQGASTAFKYEFFDSDKCHFDLSGDCSCDPRIVIEPRNYKGVVANYDEKMVLSGYPQCSYNTDSFKAWIAQQGVSLPFTIMSSAVGAYGSLAMGAEMVNNPNWAYGNASFLEGTYNNAIIRQGINQKIVNAQIGTDLMGTFVSGLQHALSPYQSHGASMGGSAIAIGIQNFMFMHKHITEEFAIKIDSFFDRFGYAVRELKTPNRNVRPHWTYLQTMGCTIKGSIPCDDALRICQIYDNGVTFWKNPREVGHYELDNSPT